MVQLYGVAHHASAWSIAGTWQVPISPAKEILFELGELPKGIKVGLEWFKEDELQKIVSDLKERCSDARLKEYAYYSTEQDLYWDVLIERCLRLGHEIIFLEDTPTWLDYNQAVVEKAIAYQERLYYEEQDTALTYHVKLCNHNEKDYRTELICRKVHEINREKRLLENIASNDLDVAIVGIGHSDNWVLRREELQELGIDLGSYSVQVPDYEGRWNETIFIANAYPDLNSLYERNSLERALRFIESGRISDNEPDYVGTWDILFPSKGYFEVLVLEECCGLVSGIIEDCLGTSSFEGKITEDGIKFTKRYGEGCSPQTIKEEIHYEGKRGDRKEFYGYFGTGLPERAFYLAKGPQKEPIELSTRWQELVGIDKE